MTSHTCPDCGRQVAQQGGRYSTPEKVYVYLYAHACAGGKRRQTTATVATKLRAGGTTKAPASSR